MSRCIMMGRTTWGQDKVLDFEGVDSWSRLTCGGWEVSTMHSLASPFSGAEKTWRSGAAGRSGHGNLGGRMICYDGSFARVKCS